ncbi:MAG: hypothetical protein WCM76_09125 [Bacteroidota bacterium]
MLKKSCLFLLAILFAPMLFAQSIPDSSLINERNAMLFHYLDLRNTGDMKQKAVIDTVLLQSDELLKLDNQLIDTLVVRSQAYNTMSNKLDIRESEYVELKMNNDLNEKMILFGMYGAAGAGLIVIVLIILIVVTASSKGKLKKKIKNTASLEQENENMKLEISSVEKVMQQNADMIEKLNRTVEMKETRIKDMQAAVDGADGKFNKKCEEYDKIILELRTNETNLISDKIKANTKASEMVNQMEARIQELERALNDGNSSSNVDTNELDALKTTHQESIRQLQNELDEAKSNFETQLNERDRQIIELKESESRIKEERGQDEQSLIQRLNERERHINELTEAQARMKEEREREEQSLMQRLSEAEARATEYETILNDPEKRAFRDAEFNKKLSEMELKIIKLGKIDRMHKDGLITDEEYGSMKQALLADF